MADIDVFVISLKNNVKRRESISRQLKGMNVSFRFFDALLGVDYITDPCFYDEKKAKKYLHRPLSAGEVGCALSHNAIYNLIVKEKLPYALILEDDVVLSVDLIPIIEALVPSLTGSRIITLDRCDVHKKETVVHLMGQYNLVKPCFIREGGMANASGYIITYEAAKNIASINFPVWSPADSWGIYLRYVDFYGVIPTQTIVHQDKARFNSTIQSGGLGITDEIAAEGGKENGRFTAPQLFLYGLKTYVPITSHIYRLVRWVYRHSIKRFCGK